MTRKLPHKDVVIIGLGWTGSTLANELKPVLKRGAMSSTCQPAP
jgi:cation diffusion facilitator CzcD-associated flavoprotein CzcO